MKITGNQLAATPTNLDSYFAGIDLGAEGIPSDGFHVSNDTRYSDIRRSLKEKAGQAAGSIGLFIGSGGMLSLLPDLNLAYPIMVDRNPAVTNFNQTLAELVSISDSPDEAMNKLAMVEAYSSDFYLSIGHYPGLDVRFYDEIVEESRVYGHDHWMNPARFPAVKEALAATPPTYVNADVTNLNFAQALQAMSSELGIPIGFANLTNVHRWLGFDEPTDFANDWPMKDDALIMYSDFFRTAGYLEMALATKLSYIDITNEYREGRTSTFGRIALDGSKPLDLAD